MEEVIILHARIWGESSETAEHYLLSRDRLDSALNRPRFAAYYEQADIYSQAATLLWGLIKAHAFLDGNKRVAWLSTRAFLLVNNLELVARSEESFDLITGIAGGRYDTEVATRWMRGHLSRVVKE